MRLGDTKIRVTAVVLFTALLAVACTGSGSTSGSATSSVGPEQARIGCPNGPFFPAEILETSPPLIADSSVPEVAAAIAPFLGSGEGDFWPQDGWRVLHVENAQAELVHLGTPDMASLSFMTVQDNGGDWQWAGASGGGSCELVQEPASDAGSIVDWELDPDAAPVTAATTTLVVRATERACASGQAMGDRLREPEVVYTDDQVRVTTTANELSGDQDCPSNPFTVVEIELTEPVGGRAVVDGRSSDLGDLRELLLDLVAAG